MTLQLETIRRDFPALDPGDANVIDACCLHDVAASNVRRILRSCPEEHLGQGGGIVADEILHHHPDVRDAMDDTPDAFDYWDYQCGFSEVRTRVLQAALSAMGGRMLETLIRELGDIEPWIACMAEMGIAPAVSDWADCLEQHERWQNVVRGRQCEYAAADFWAEHDDLHAWNTLSGAVAMDGLVIVPILSPVRVRHRVRSSRSGPVPTVRQPLHREPGEAVPGLQRSIRRNHDHLRAVHGTERVGAVRAVVRGGGA